VSTYKYLDIYFINKLYAVIANHPARSALLSSSPAYDLEPESPHTRTFFTLYDE
jgi:hypothetical protein